MQNLSIESIFPNEEDIRNIFQMDRDRILYLKPFRRMSGKTQVFYARTDDHIRNRLTHTLEVNQISNTFVNYLPKKLKKEKNIDLKLNYLLSEAIALGHDIGHTPFGHAGEKILNSYTNGNLHSIVKDINFDCVLNEDEKGFKHNLQGIRILKELTKNNKGERDLNISDYTLWGIMNHTGYKSHKNGFYKDYIEKYGTSQFLSIEALIVREADEISQRHHDIEDTMDLDLVDYKEIIRKIGDVFNQNIESKNMLKNLFEKLISEKNIEKSTRLKILSKIIIDIYIDEYLKTFINIISQLKTKEKIFDEMSNEKLLNYSDNFKEKDLEFKNFLKNLVLNSQSAHMMDGRGTYIIKKLFEAYMTNPQQMPNKTIDTLFYNLGYKGERENNKLRIFLRDIHGNIGKNCEVIKELGITNREYKAKLIRTITDFISNMTDEFAIKQYNNLYGITY